MLAAWGEKFRHARLRHRMEGIRLYITAVSVCVVLAILWASLAPMDKVVRVSGKIIPAGRGREIQHLEGGIIASINAREGSTVKKGDVLMTIEDVAADANLGETNVKLNAERLRAARLDAEARGLDQVELPEDLQKVPGVEAELSLFANRKNKLQQEVLVHEGAMRQQTARLNETRTRQAKLVGELQVARDRTKLMADLASRNAASKLEVLEAQSREKRLETEINDAASSIPTLEGAIAEERARAGALKADFTATAQTELVAARAEAARLQQVMLGAADRVKRTEIRAPMDGVINRIAVNTLGGVVKPGDKLIELIPFTNEVLIEARAQPKDRGNLLPGQTASVRISAYDVGELGVLKSKVTEVSADTMLDQRGEAYYRVNLLVSDLPASYQNHLMAPGMTATADIVTGRRTIMALLLSPIRKFTYSMFRDSR